MLNASQIITLIPENGSLVLCFTRTRDGQVTVVVDPRYPKSDGKKENDTLQAALSPKTVTGTPEMLDADFMAYLSKSIAAATNIKTQIENIDKEAQAAIDKAKAEASKKVAEASRNKAKSSLSAAKHGGKSAAPSPTQAVLGEQTDEDDQGEGEGSAGESNVEEKEPVKPEVKTPAPALALF